MVSGSSAYMLHVHLREHGFWRFGGRLVSVWFTLAAVPSSGLLPSLAPHWACFVLAADPSLGMLLQLAHHWACLFCSTSTSSSEHVLPGHCRQLIIFGCCNTRQGAATHVAADHRSCSLQLAPCFVRCLDYPWTPHMADPFGQPTYLAHPLWIAP